MGCAPGSRRVESRWLLGAFSLVHFRQSICFDGTMALARGWARGSRRVRSRWLLRAFCLTCSLRSLWVSGWTVGLADG